MIEGSLTQQKTDRNDLYYQHRVDPALLIEDVAGAVRDLIQDGKVLHFGLSEASASTIRRAHTVQSLAAVQAEYPVMERSIESNGVLAPVKTSASALCPGGPMGMGYLTGKMDGSTQLDAATDLRTTFDRFSPANLAASMPMVELMRRRGRTEGCHPQPDRSGLAADVENLDHAYPRRSQPRPSR